MHDILLVHVVESKKDLLDQLCCFLLTKSLMLNNMVVKFATGNQLRHDVKVDWVVEKFEDPRNMRMLRILQNLQLLLHQVEEDLVFADVLLMDNLDCARHSCLPIHTLTHLTKRPLA